MASVAPLSNPPLDPAKFQDPQITAKGEPRASVRLKSLQTLWFNTGTLCNLTCADCYIESSPTNDRLAYITRDEVLAYLDEIAADRIATEEIGFTGGEPFMNPHLPGILEDCLRRGFRVLVLTNAMRPMLKCAETLVDLNRRFGDRMVLRVSIDHYTETLHETERGRRSWKPTIDGITWLDRQGFAINVAGRLKWGEPEASMRAGYRRLFARLGLSVDAENPVELVLFPEMDAAIDTPEITTACWGLLRVNPDDMMCATSRMVVKRKGEANPVVMPCTLLPYDSRFEMGPTLGEAAGPVALNHPHCARFCVLGGGSCSVRSG